MSATNQIADALEKSGIPFTRVEGSVDGIEYWGLTVIHENIHAEVRECADWVEMKVWHYTPEQFMNMLVGVGTCKNIGDSTFVCSKCGAHVQITDVGRSYLDENGKRWYSTSNEHKFRHCPNCGRRIIEEEAE